MKRAPSPDSSLQPLEDVYRSHRMVLRAYLLRHGVRADAAADLVQDTFARAVRAWPSFRGDSSLSTWVYGIARIVLADHFRQLGRSPEDHAFSLDDIDPAAGDAVDVLTATLGQRPSGNTMPTNLAIRRALAQFARQHPQRAEVLHLVLLNGWTAQELGEWMGRTPHAATEYLSQCRQVLMAMLDDHVPNRGQA
jgi:RNA polymerase sigma factor (sigma-70 family)